VLEVGVPALLARIDAACVINEMHPAVRPFFLEGAEVHGLTDAAAIADAAPPQLAACFRGTKAPHLVQMKFMNALFPAMEPARMVASDPLHLGGTIMLGGELATVNAPVEMHPLHRRSSELTEASDAAGATISSYRLVRMKIVPLKVYRSFGLLAKGHAAVRADKALEISTAFPLATLTTMAVGVLQAFCYRTNCYLGRELEELYGMVIFLGGAKRDTMNSNQFRVRAQQQRAWRIGARPGKERGAPEAVPRPGIALAIRQKGRSRIPLGSPTTLFYLSVQKHLVADNSNSLR
jgi:hypothetical protein